MKKLLSLIILAFALQKADAIPACYMYWQGNAAFFEGGGIVSVRHQDGSGYYVDVTNFRKPSQYGIQNNSQIYVFRPERGGKCGAVTWGHLFFCPCPEWGLPRGPLVLKDNAFFEILQGFIVCNCPTGASNGGVVVLQVSPCAFRFPPPPPQPQP